MTTLAPSFLIGSSLFLQVKKVNHESVDGFTVWHIRPWTLGLAALERLKNPHRLILGEMV